jgi:hypothetical protein
LVIFSIFLISDIKIKKLTNWTLKMRQKKCKEEAFSAFIFQLFNCTQTSDDIFHAQTAICYQKNNR